MNKFVFFFEVTLIIFVLISQKVYNNMKTSDMTRALCEKLVEAINPEMEKEKSNPDVFISNYSYLTQKALNDLDEINIQIGELRSLD